MSIKKRVFGRDIKNENHNILNMPLLNPPKNNNKYKPLPTCNQQNQNHKILSFQFDNPKQSNSSFLSLDSVEQQLENDPQYVTEYSVEIFKYLKQNEVSYHISVKNYIII